jgi:hypothetical protein
MGKALSLLLIVALNCACSAQIMQQGVIHSVAPASGSITWTLVQHPNNFTCGTTGTGSTQTLSCTVTTSSTTAGDLLILVSATYMGLVTVAPTYSSASGDSSWTHCSGAYSTISNGGSGNSETVDCAFILSATGGATSVTWTWTGTVTSGGHSWDADAELLEYRRSTGTASFDAAGSTTAAGTAARTSPSCAVTGNGDVVIQFIAESEDIVSIGGPYTNPIDIENTNVVGGVGGALNQTNGAAQTWTTSGDTSTDAAAMGAICFK